MLNNKICSNEENILKKLEDNNICMANKINILTEDNNLKIDNLNTFINTVKSDCKNDFYKKIDGKYEFLSKKLDD